MAQLDPFAHITSPLQRCFEYLRVWYAVRESPKGQDLDADLAHRMRGSVIEGLCYALYLESEEVVRARQKALEEAGRADAAELRAELAELETIKAESRALSLQNQLDSLTLAKPNHSRGPGQAPRAEKGMRNGRGGKRR